MAQDTKQILASHEQIFVGIDLVAAAIAKDYERKDLLLIGVLKGAIFFQTYLMIALGRHGYSRAEMSFVGVSTYSGKGRQRDPAFYVDMAQEIEGKHVLIVEDVLDTGTTLSFVVAQMQQRGIASLRTAVLVNKPATRLVDIEADYVALELPDVWIEGFGFDVDQFGRGYPDIFTRE